jgi:hypothetical protein
MRTTIVYVDRVYQTVIYLRANSFTPYGANPSAVALRQMCLRRGGKVCTATEKFSPRKKGANPKSGANRVKVEKYMAVYPYRIKIDSSL